MGPAHISVVLMMIKLFGHAIIFYLIYAGKGIFMEPAG